MLEPYWFTRASDLWGLKIIKNTLWGTGLEYQLRHQELWKSQSSRYGKNAVFRKRGYSEPHELVVYSNARAPVDFICKPMKFDAGRNNLYSLERTRHA